QVSQEDFADLQVLQSAGSLSLTPIGRNDDEIGTETIETNIQDVLGIEAVVVEEAPEVVEERICTRRERRGVDIVTLQVPCED
ncbi:MAG: Flp pilus assembly protein CpaB, partial [Paracoccaceae bacterium]|nr:Flp pilus assembly protein CpaB [Paracoccaceae bacterium]